MNPLVYCFVDVELDGPSPGENSMLSIACHACTERGALISEFIRNLYCLEGATADQKTANWWASQPVALAAISVERQQPIAVITDFVTWVKQLPGDAVFAAHPLILDGLWVDWYLRQFASMRLFDGPFSGAALFVGAGIDIPSYVQASWGMPYFRVRPNYPPEMLDGLQATHQPIDDARSHAALFFNAKRRVEKSAT